MEFVYYLIRLGISAAVVLGIRWIWMRHANSLLLPIANRMNKIEGHFEKRDGMLALTNDALLDLQDDINLAITELNHLFGKGNSYSETLINARKKASLRKPVGYIPAEVEIIASTVKASAYDHGTIYDEQSTASKYRTSMVWISITLAMERIIYGFYNFDSYKVLFDTWVKIFTGS